MKANPKKRIAISAVPGGTARITCIDVDSFMRAGETDADILPRLRSSPDAVTEIVPMTEFAVTRFCQTNNTRLFHGMSLAEYPYPKW